MDVAAIQRALLARGYDIGHAGPNRDGVDGDYGALTTKAMRSFQAAHALPASGTANAATLALLRAPAGLSVKPSSAPPWFNLAAADMGLHEGVGPADNPKVVSMFAACGHPEVKHDSTAWCAAFVGAKLAEAGQRGTGSLWALDYAKWGVKLPEPVLGAVGVKKRPGGGHVFFIAGANASSIFALGGNQGDEVCIETIPRDKVIAFRWPSDVPIPSASTLPTTVAAARSSVSEA